ncbi:MAG: TIGR04255 family protein [Betaproteobacteria bacterium]|nr:TIGR04255 family protein [Betaproteobacteria bacterium]
MDTGSLGQLPNAPLAYVLGAVKFDQQLNLDKHVPALQERLQGEFPRFRPVQEAILNIAGGSAPQAVVRYEFSSADNCHGVVLNQETLVFHVTGYSTYEDYGRRLDTVLQHVGAELKYLFVRRVGLRYVDVLIPEEGETPDDYVGPGLRSVPALSVPSQYRSGLVFSEFEMGQGMLVLRYATNRTKQGLPPDLQPLVLAEPEVMRRPVPDGALSGTLDFDRFVMLEAPFESTYVRSVFDLLHEDLSVAFREFTTDHARHVWSRRPGR